MIFNKGAKDILGRKDSLLNKPCWENWISTCKRIKLKPYLILNTKNHSKQTKDLNIRRETLKLLEENIGEMS